MVAAVALAAGLASGCGGSATAPRTSLSGTFALTSVDGQGLPVARLIGLLGAAEEIMLSGRLQFLSRGRLLDIRETQVHVFATGEYSPPVTDSIAYAYRVAGDTLYVLHTAFDTAAAYSDTGFVSGTDAISLRVRGNPFDQFFGAFFYGRIQ
jgi:hypothetical protein